jgi:pyruvate dehydrogenase E2 component (dihydrolipoamide acetyltransferase)
MNNEIPFNIRRKVIASTTYEGWKKSPHVSYVYEADATDFYAEYIKLNLSGKYASHISFNTLLIRIIVEGIKAAPQMNATIQYNPFLVIGKITVTDEININMPFLLSGGEMLTINLRNFGNKSLHEMTEYINRINIKIKNTNIELALLDVGFSDTLKELRHGKIIKAFGRILGILINHKNIHRYSKTEKKAYINTPLENRLSKNDLNQGTITISNLGSAVQGTKGVVGLLEIVPPQVCVIGIGALQEKPGIYYKDNNLPQIGTRKIIPFTIAFDHRALDFGDIAPFINQLESIFNNSSVIHTL